MRRQTFWSAAVGLAMLVGAGAVWADEDEQDIALEDLPKAVVEAVKARFPGAELAEAEKETEKGRTLYEVELKHNAQEIVVSVTPEGTIVEIEKEVTEKDLPKAVRKAVAEKYPGSTIQEAEEITVVKDGKDQVPSYEVAVATPDKKTRELLLKPDGTISSDEPENDDDLETHP
ncbi:MAG: PepSY-like domain-containing protein [Pirellulales bacterium]